MELGLLSTTAPNLGMTDKLRRPEATSGKPAGGEVADPGLLPWLALMLEAVYRSAEARHKGTRESIETIALRIRAYDDEWPAESIALWERVPVRDVARIRASR